MENLHKRILARLYIEPIYQLLQDCFCSICLMNYKSVCGSSTFWFSNYEIEIVINKYPQTMKYVILWIKSGTIYYREYLIAKLQIQKYSSNKARLGENSF